MQTRHQITNYQTERSRSLDGNFCASTFGPGNKFQSEIQNEQTVLVAPLDGTYKWSNSDN